MAPWIFSNWQTCNCWIFLHFYNFDMGLGTPNLYRKKRSPWYQAFIPTHQPGAASQIPNSDIWTSCKWDSACLQPCSRTKNWSNLRNNRFEGIFFQIFVEASLWIYQTHEQYRAELLPWGDGKVSLFRYCYLCLILLSNLHTFDDIADTPAFGLGCILLTDQWSSQGYGRWSSL